MDPTKKELYDAKRPSGINASDPYIQEVTDLLRSDNDPTNWVMFKVSGTTVAVHAIGSCGLSEFSSALTDDEVLYGVVRCEVDGKIRFYHIFFVGQGVSAMKKGKASLFKSAIFGLIDAQGEIGCSNGLEEYSEDLIRSSIARLAGTTNILI